jgi:hypothetical protein
MDFEAAERVLDALEREGFRYIVFGAASLNLLGLARLTELERQRFHLDEER